jgi:hypothetical protein
MNVPVGILHVFSDHAPAFGYALVQCGARLAPGLLGNGDEQALEDRD